MGRPIWPSTAPTLTRWEATDLFGELLATYDPVSGTVDEVVRNHLGTNQERARDSFGNPVLASTGFSSHALTWHTQDPTGLVYARARYLDPKTGRFLSEDPIVSGNLYNKYAWNNPVNARDPYVLLPDALHPRSGVKPRTGWGADARGGAVHAQASYPQEVHPRGA